MPSENFKKGSRVCPTQKTRFSERQVLGPVSQQRTSLLFTIRTAISETKFDVCVTSINVLARSSSLRFFPILETKKTS